VVPCSPNSADSALEGPAARFGKLNCPSGAYLRRWRQAILARQPRDFTLRQLSGLSAIRAESLACDSRRSEAQKTKSPPGGGTFSSAVQSGCSVGRTPNIAAQGALVKTGPHFRQREAARPIPKAPRLLAGPTPEGDAVADFHRTQGHPRPAADPALASR
jgi:hypothetical protein